MDQHMETSYGTILYQGSHINDGNGVADFDPEHIGELRMYGNFLLESALETAPEIITTNLELSQVTCSGDDILDRKSVV